MLKSNMNPIWLSLGFLILAGLLLRTSCNEDEPEDNNNIPPVTSTSWIKETQDGGVSWDPAHQISGKTKLTKCCILGYERTVVAIGANTRGEGAIFRKTQYDNNWREVLSDAKILTFSDITTLLYSDGHGIVVGDSGVIYMTADYFGTWFKPTSPTNKNLHAIDFFNDETIGYAVGQNGTMIRTMDGGYSWSMVNNSPTNEALDDISIIGPYSANNSTLLVVDELGMLFRSNDTGASWTEVNITRAATAVYFPPYNSPNPNLGLYVGLNGEIFKSTDGGMTWTEKQSPVENVRLEDVIIGVDGNCIAVGHGVILHSPDYGETWSKVYEDHSYWFYGVYLQDENSFWGFAIGIKD